MLDKTFVKISSHVAAASILLVLGFLIDSVNANAGVFTYYETPMFDRIGNTGYVMAHAPAVGAGPSQWKNIL